MVHIPYLGYSRICYNYGSHFMVHLVLKDLSPCTIQGCRYGWLNAAVSFGGSDTSVYMVAADNTYHGITIVQNYKVHVSLALRCSKWYMYGPQTFKCLYFLCVYDDAARWGAWPSMTKIP